MNAKQFSKLVAVFFCVFLVSFFVMDFAKDRARQLFEELLSAFPYLVAIMVAFSGAVFAYLDNIAKDLIDVRNEVDRRQLGLVQEQLTSLRREVIHNAGLVLVCFFLERAIKGVGGGLIDVFGEQLLIFVQEGVVSSRVSLIGVALWAIYVQFSGLVIAAEYREVIVKNRK